MFSIFGRLSVEDFLLLRIRGMEKYQKAKKKEKRKKKKAGRGGGERKREGGLHFGGLCREIFLICFTDVYSEFLNSSLEEDLPPTQPTTLLYIA